MNCEGFKFYYYRLSDGEKNLYNRICGALLNFEPALSVHAGMGKPFTVDTEKIITAVLLDNPVFFYLSREGVITEQTPMYIRLGFRYTYAKNEAEELWQKIEERIELFMKYHITPGMSALTKQIHIHDFLYTVRPDSLMYENDSFSVVGAFLHSRCVCDGYAKAYKLLCDRLGIYSVIVPGEAISGDGQWESHTWNITRINGVAAHTDAMWDSRFSGASYDYFNICDADISKDHSFDTELYPKCEPNTIDYFHSNNMIAANENQVKRIISSNWNKPYYSVKLTFPFSQKQAEALPFDIGTIRYNAAQNIIGYVRTILE